MAEQNHQQQDLREILQIRRDKLKALQDAGMNPFEITRYDVTHHAQEVKDHFDALDRVSGRPPDVQARHGQGVLLRFAG